jgi:hypothetical protein
LALRLQEVELTIKELRGRPHCSRVAAE